MSLIPTQTENNPHLPDISATTKTGFASQLELVGMKRIEVPIWLNVNGESLRVPATVDAFVNLMNPEAKGIHMSRLYRQVTQALSQETLNFALMSQILKNFVESHTGLSDKSALTIRFDLSVERPALLSSEKGWRSYPVILKGEYDKGVLKFEAEVKILYSSTCPCSAALSRRLVAEKFIEDFKTIPLVSTETVMKWLEDEKSIVAVPHSQRSEATILVKLSSSVLTLNTDFSPLHLIDMAEKAVGTPVQSAVKRVDEQEFARLNGENLMFCEDAARKLQATFIQMPEVLDYRIEVQHLESLHAHDAVAIATKGIEGGYTA
jgi:GTP cyclohydrolase IB